MPSEWAKAKAREGDEERLLGGYVNPRWLEVLRNEVLEEAAAACASAGQQGAQCRTVTDDDRERAAGMLAAAEIVRAMKHTEDTSDG